MNNYQDTDSLTVTQQRQRIANMQDKASKGDIHAASQLGWMYEHGECGAPSSIHDAIIYHRQAAMAGNVTSSVAMGDYHLHGDGQCVQSIETAEYWYRHAMHHENLIGTFSGRRALADLLFFEKGTLVDKDAAIELYQTIVDRGGANDNKAHACFVLGRAMTGMWDEYTIGDGPGVNHRQFKKGIEFIRTAAAMFGDDSPTYARVDAIRFLAAAAIAKSAEAHNGFRLTTTITEDVLRSAGCNEDEIDEFTKWKDSLDLKSHRHYPSLGFVIDEFPNENVVRLLEVFYPEADEDEA